MAMGVESLSLKKKWLFGALDIFNIYLPHPHPPPPFFSQYISTSSSSTHSLLFITLQRELRTKRSFFLHFSNIHHFYLSLSLDHFLPNNNTTHNNSDDQELIGSWHTITHNTDIQRGAAELIIAIYIQSHISSISVKSYIDQFLEISIWNGL